MNRLGFMVLAGIFILQACGEPRPRMNVRTQRAADVPIPQDAMDAEVHSTAESVMTEDEILARDRVETEVLNQQMKERYLGARGLDLRLARAELAPGVENASLRSYQSLVDKLMLVFGKSLAEIPLTDSSSFTISRPLQNDTPNYGVSSYRLFATATVGLCKGLVQANAAKFIALPNADTLPKQCQEWGEKFWFRSMTAAELQICMNAGLELSKTTTVVSDRWAQVCGVIATAPQFLVIDTLLSAMSGSGTPSNTGTTPSSTILGNAATGRQLFTASCVGCHGANRPIKARTDPALQAAITNMNHIGREVYFKPAATPTEYHHILAFLKSLGM